MCSLIRPHFLNFSFGVSTFGDLLPEASHTCTKRGLIVLVGLASGQVRVSGRSSAVERPRRGRRADRLCRPARPLRTGHPEPAVRSPGVGAV